MPIIGFGLLYIVIAIFFSVHAIRNGRSMYWLIFLFLFPLVGSIAYFFMEFVSGSQVERGLSRASSQALRALDPSREVREATRAFELTPTVQNRMRLANAFLAANRASDAVAQFELCLQGPFAGDPEILFAASRAKLLAGDAAGAEALLVEVRDKNPLFRTEAIGLLMAQALAAQSKQAQAKAEFTHTVAQHGGVQAMAEYAIWCASTGDLATARSLRAELAQTWKYWDRHTRALNAPLLHRVDVALAAGSRSIA